MKQKLKINLTYRCTNIYPFNTTNFHIKNQNTVSKIKIGEDDYDTGIYS